MTRGIEALIANNRAWSARMQSERPGFFAHLCEHQSPLYMWIGCSDSRVPANQITGLLPGEAFVHRNVGDAVVHSDLNALSAIQFAVDILKVEHILVVGHLGCGAVAAALQKRRVGLADNWICHIKCVAERHSHMISQLSPQRQINALVELNVIEQAYAGCGSTVLHDAWAAGACVSVHAMVYSLADGLLRALRFRVHSEGEIESCRVDAAEGVRRRYSPVGSAA